LSSEEITIHIDFFFSSRRRHTRCLSDWSSDVCSSDLDVFLRWNLVDSHPGRRREADRAAVAVRRGALHPELHVLRRHAELVLERSEEHTSELQSLRHLVCRLLLEKKKKKNTKDKHETQ